MAIIRKKRKLDSSQFENEWIQSDSKPPSSLIYFNWIRPRLGYLIFYFLSEEKINKFELFGLNYSTKLVLEQDCSMLWHTVHLHITVSLVQHIGLFATLRHWGAIYNENSNSNPTIAIWVYERRVKPAHAIIKNHKYLLTKFGEKICPNKTVGHAGR